MAKLLYIRQYNVKTSKHIKPAIIVGDSTTENGRDGAYHAKGEENESDANVIEYNDIRDCETGEIYKWPKIEVLPLTEKYNRDYAVHNFLKEYGTDLVSYDGETSEGCYRTREAFIVKPGHTVAEVVEFIRNEIEGTTKKTAFGLRPYQVKPTAQIIQKFDNYNDVLLQAAPRFGKSFVSLRVAKNLSKNRILILTPFPDAKFSFKSVVEKHEMMQDYEFIDLNNIKRLKHAKKFVMFLSWQTFAGGNNAALLAKIKPDFIIIDEMHRQSDSEKSKAILQQIDSTNEVKKLFLSATPYNDIMYGDFAGKSKQIITCDLLYMMNAAAKTATPFPKLNFYFPENCESVYEALSKKFKFEDSDKFTLDKMIGDVNHPEYALAYWKHYFTSDVDELTGLPRRKTLFTQVNKPSHIIVFVPDGAADINYKAFKELTENKDSTIYGYKILQASAEENEVSIKKFETDVNKFQQDNAKTIVITKGKGTTGVTIEKLQCVIIAKKMQSTELFVQVACRPITPCNGKNEALVFCMDSEMRLTLAKAANVGVNTAANEAVKRLREFLKVINVYYHTDNSFVKETAEDLLKFIKEIKVKTVNEFYKDCRNLVLPDFDDEILNMLAGVNTEKKIKSWAKSIGQGGNAGAKSRKTTGKKKSGQKKVTDLRDKIFQLLKNLDWKIYANNVSSSQKLLKLSFDNNAVIDRCIHEVISENLSLFDDICYKINHTSPEVLYQTLSARSDTDRIEHSDIIARVFSKIEKQLKTCDITAKFADPCAGRGNYILAMLNRLMQNKNFVSAFPDEAKRRRYITENVIFPNDIDEMFVYILKKMGFINTTNFDASAEEYQKMLKKKKIDYIIMNPPYEKTLHLRILANVAQCGMKEIVNLSPVVNYVSRKNAYSNKHIAKFDTQPIKEHCASIDRLSLDDMVKHFGAGAQNAIGIQHYVMNTEYNVIPTTYVDGDIDLIRKIMLIAMKDSCAQHQDGSFILRFSGIHGHMDKNAKDTYFFMSLTWEAQLNTKGANTIGFNTEVDAHDFYDFWMSKYGVQLTKLWKNDTHVYPKFIPYFWAKKGKEKEAIMKKFNLSETEFKTLMNM